MSDFESASVSRELAITRLLRAIVPGRDSLPFTWLIIGLVILGSLFIGSENQSLPDPIPSFSQSNNNTSTAADHPDYLAGSKIKSSNTLGYQTTAQSRTTSVSTNKALTHSQQIIGQLQWLLDQPSDHVTISQIKKLLVQLTDQGDAGVPMIREFLLSGKDHSLPAHNAFRQSSLRLALIDSLHRIGGEQADMVSVELLKTGVSAREFVVLSGFLENQDAGLYHSDIQYAGQQILAKSTDVDGVELGPVYQLLGEAGATSVDELSQAPQHMQHYASVTLALLPDGKGVPALLEELKRSGKKFDSQKDQLRLKLLAQVAVDQPEAATALADLASQNLIPDKIWPEIAAIAAGLEQIQLSKRDGTVLSQHQITSANGNQILYRSRTDGPRDAAEALARLAFVERLFRSAPDGAANQALASALDRLPNQYQGIFWRQSQ